ncbi:acyl-CoA carboxylase subunit epsilon [Intrasporangium sp.]|uniref:acyl-CoA carboxylase subunit epsilon n=1 Tax=Intrasporangium sp. TaxID=1925024 RepID=UPI00293B5A7E|nr:acyl-CoA carboxylase subunit epsilon [Intrasporangium sp.]MDV3221436.1 acyl-CoA carboxylase subunit epsilon [Intrasporangium sp.]
MTAHTATNGPGSGGPEGRASEASPARVRVLRGHPNPEEIAALVAVLSGVGGGPGEPPPARRSAWSDPAWRLVGPSARRGGWRTSALPR